SGGMVVKNVAGLDMGKLMIGSFGTLSAIAVVNFKVVPMPDAERSFLLAFPSCAAASGGRNPLVRGVLNPGAIHLFRPTAGGGPGERGEERVAAGGADRGDRRRHRARRARSRESRRGDGVRWRSAGSLVGAHRELHTQIPV